MALVLILQLLTLCELPFPPPWVPVWVPPVSYPKPWLGARPATVVTPRVNVTLRCRAPQPAWRFALFKSGETDPLLLREVSSELAEFFLEEVTPAQGGSYHCCYGKPDWAPSVWSQPSDALELLVTGEVLGPSSLGPGNWGVRTLSPPQRQETWSSGPRLLGPSADSPSPPARPADSSSSDYTRENLVRLGLAGLVLISLGVLVAFDCRSQNHAPAGVRP
uniref:Osteoclast associated Ig-like receptor n=1 Tax=Cebus imitator TaxID=2715852 RepID=A0A2K5RL99_CEBIM